MLCQMVRIRVNSLCVLHDAMECEEYQGVRWAVWRFARMVKNVIIRRPFCWDGNFRRLEPITRRGAFVTR